MPRPVANASNITAHERTLEQARSSTNNQLLIAFLDLIGKDEVASSKIGDASNRTIERLLVIYTSLFKK